MNDKQLVCDVCGSTSGTYSEPRFLYITCKDCENIPPIKRHMFRGLGRTPRKEDIKQSFPKKMGA